MGFHRLVAPTYYGGLPAGYDYINNPSANGDAGTAAFADAKKTGGANAGTYFVAFGEDATSSNTNRGLKALSENTDILDNLFHRDIALTARTADVTAGAPVSSFTLSGQIFVGESGVSNNQATRDLLVSVLDNSDNEIITSSGAKVTAQLIHDGSNNNVVGTQSSGFYNTPTVTLSAPIPTGTTYRVYYGERSNLANLPKDAFTTIKIRGAQEVTAEVERTLRDLHKATGATWNDPWLVNINTLGRTGLDGRYRNTTADPGSTPAVDTPGAGGTITRDGPAVTFSLPTYNLTTFGTVGVDTYPDPVLACLRLTRAAPAVATAFDLSRGGDVGLVQESPYHSTSDASEEAYSHVTGPLLLDMIPRSILASTLSTNNVLSRISTTALATVNPDAGVSADDRRTIQVGPGDFIRNGSGRSALRKTDLLEVINNATGKSVGTFRVEDIASDTRVRVKALSGGNPPLGPSGASATVRLRWLQPTVSIGGYHKQATGFTYGTPHFMVAHPGAIVETWNANAHDYNAVFLSALSRRDLSGFIDDVLYQALNWGGYDTVGNYQLHGALQGDGGIYTDGGRQQMNLLNLNPQSFIVNNGGRTISFNPFAGSQVHIPVSGVSGSSPVIFTIDTSLGYAEKSGDSFEIVLTIPAGTVGPLTFTWPSNFKFSGNDGVVPSTNPGLKSMTVRYRFRYAFDTFWYAERWDYTNVS